MAAGAGQVVDDTVRPAVELPSLPIGVRLAIALGIHDAGRALRDFATYLPSQVLPAAASFAVLPFLTRTLFPTEVGVVTLDQMLMMFGAIAAGSWYTAAIVRELPAAPDSSALRKTLGHGFGVSVAFLGVFLALVVAAGQLSSAIGNNLGPVMLGTCGFFLETVSGALFIARLRPRPYVAIELVSRVGGIGLGVALIYEGHGLQGYLLGVGILPFAAGLIALVLGWPRGHQPITERSTDATSIRIWLHYGLPVAAGSVLYWGLSSIDRYMLAWIKDAGDAGVYSIGSTLGDRTVSIPLFAFMTAATPLLMQSYEHSGRTEVERLMRAYTRIMLLIGLPLIALAAAVSTKLVAAITGNRVSYYHSASSAVPLVAVGALLMALGNLSGSGLGASRRTRLLLIGTLGGLLVNVGANLILIPAYGIMGAAIATPLGSAAYLAITYAAARRFARWHFPYGTFARSIAAAAVAYAIARAASLAGPTPVASLGIALVAGGAAYTLTLLALGERQAATRSSRRVSASLRTRMSRR